MCERTLDYPVIVKPASQGSSIGISAAHDGEELAEALAVAARFDDKLVVEEKLTDFVEVNCAAYARGGEVIVSETERPLSAGELLTFEDKYVSGGKMSGGGREMPAPVGDELNALVRTLTERIYRTMELKGVVRVDFLVDRVREKVYINEVTRCRAPWHSIFSSRRKEFFGGHLRHRGGRGGKGCGKTGAPRLFLARAFILRQGSAWRQVRPVGVGLSLAIAPAMCYHMRIAR